MARPKDAVSGQGQLLGGGQSLQGRGQRTHEGDRKVLRVLCKEESGVSEPTKVFHFL